MNLPLLVFQEVDREHWADFERLFESKGAPNYCWCMAWRATAEEYTHHDGPDRKIAMAKRVEAGIPVGLLGYLNGEPIAWCSVAPRSTFRNLVKGGGSDEGIWSITCFFLPRRLRGSGITYQLIEAAVELAARKGAKVVEAYPVDPDSPSYRHMGFLSAFQAAGFHEVGRVGIRRHIFRREIGQAAPNISIQINIENSPARQENARAQGASDIEP